MRNTKTSTIGNSTFWWFWASLKEKISVRKLKSFLSRKCPFFYKNWRPKIMTSQSIWTSWENLLKIIWRHSLSSTREISHYLWKLFSTTKTWDKKPNTLKLLNPSRRWEKKSVCHSETIDLVKSFLSNHLFIISIS